MFSCCSVIEAIVTRTAAVNYYDTRTVMTLFILSNVRVGKCLWSFRTTLVMLDFFSINYLDHI